jgi:hypothetical protein
MQVYKLRYSLMRNNTPFKLSPNVCRMEQIFSRFELASSAHKHQESTSIRTRSLSYSIAAYTEWRTGNLTLEVKQQEGRVR